MFQPILIGSDSRILRNIANYLTLYQIIYDFITLFARKFYDGLNKIIAIHLLNIS